MQTVPLYELGEVVSGSTPKTSVPEFWDGDIPWITPADLSDHAGIYFDGTPKRISKAGFESCSTAMLPPGSILFSSRAPIGHCALTAYSLCTNQGFKNVVPNKRLDPVYGYFALKFLTPAIVAMGRGATFAEINKELFESVQVPYCDLPEQRRIAGRLEQADRLVRTRRSALELTDTFLQALFLELFGNPNRNEKRWSQITWGDVVSISSGKGFKLAEYSSTGVRLLQIANVTFGEIDWRIKAFLPVTYLDTYPALVLRAGDLVMALNRPILGNRVKFAVLSADDGPSILYQRVGKVRLNSESVLQPFLCGFMLTDYFFHELKKRLTGSDQPYINPPELDSVRIPVPPLPLQQKFADLVKRVERLRAVQCEALRQAEHLFASLLDRAFNS